MKEYVTWEQVEDFVTSICHRYRSERFTGVYGLPRGGLVLAVMLSHRLNIPLLSAPYHNCLIVDDICDSGESLLHYVNNSSGEDENSPIYHIVTMYYKPNKLGIEPEEYGYVKGNEWIVFPWEEN